MKARTTNPRSYQLRAPHERAESGRAPSRNPAAGAPLTAKQKAALCQLARKAYDHLDGLGLVDAPGSSESARLKAWRAAQQAEAVGIASLTECGNGHYRTLRAHFNALLGRDDVAFTDHLRTGRVKDHGAEEDTHEARETYRKLIMHELLAHGARCDSLKPTYDHNVARAVAGIVFGTASLGDDFGQITSCTLTRSGDEIAIENNRGGTRAMILANPGLELDIEVIFDASVEPPAMGEAITFPYAEVVGRVMPGAAIKWEGKGSRKLSFKAKHWDSMATETAPASGIFENKAYSVSVAGVTTPIV